MEKNSKNFRIPKSKHFWSKIIKIEYRFSEFQNPSYFGQKLSKFEKNFKIQKSKFFGQKLSKFQKNFKFST